MKRMLKMRRSILTWTAKELADLQRAVDRQVRDLRLRLSEKSLRLVGRGDQS